MLNALLGAPVVPIGVTPVTAIPTFIKAGPKAAARIAFQDGKEPLVTSVEGEIPGVLKRYISEVKNPHNRFSVEIVEIEVRSEFLDHGIVLVDTPGVGSTFVHNTRAAEAVLTECDAAVFVVSPDPPITEAEVSYLSKVQELIPKIFFALNKVDLLDSQERSTAERFLADVLKEQPVVPQPFRIFSISAKQGLQAKLDRDSQALVASGVEHLEQVLAGELAREKREIVFATGRLGRFRSWANCFSRCRTNTTNARARAINSGKTKLARAKTRAKRPTKQPVDLDDHIDLAAASSCNPRRTRPMAWRSILAT